MAYKTLIPGQMMGNCGELCAEEYHFSREDQDAYATEAYKRAAAAYENGWFADELVSVEIPGTKRFYNC